MPAVHYFSVFIDYGRRGLEAIVDPEITRRSMIDRIVSGEYENVAFIHETQDFGDGEQIVTTDITREVLDEVEQIRANSFEMEPAE